MQNVITIGPPPKPPTIPGYKPKRFAGFVDNMVGLFAPGMAERRLDARVRLHVKQHLMSAGSAQSNNARPNANPNTSPGETNRGNSERRQMMWNSLELVENSGLASAIEMKIADYVCGRIRYQARTGDRGVNRMYEDYMKWKLGKASDFSRRHTLRVQGMLAVRGIVVRGDVGLNVVKEANDFYLQGIDADRIGNPYEYRATEDYIGGVHLDTRGGYSAFDIFTKDRMSGYYSYDMTAQAYNNIGMPMFLFAKNPRNFEEVRGRTVFSAILNQIYYLEKVREYELQASMWASSQSGVYYTNSGTIPEGMPFDNTTEVDQFGNSLVRFAARPNTITAMGTAERIEMFKNERPSPNVMALYRETIREVSTGCNLSFGFVYDLTGLQGTAVRQASGQDNRTIQGWQMMLQENLLDPTAILFLGAAIARGDLPFHPRWMQGAWSFPAKPTVDQGYESTSNINENVAGLTPGQTIAAERGDDFEETQEQIGHETSNWITVAKNIANECDIKDWREVYGMLRAGKSIMMSPAFEAARAGQLEAQSGASPKDPEEAGATSEGADME